jgi:MFS family permease
MSILHRGGSVKARHVAPMVGLVFLGVLQAIQTSDPNINSTALLRAAKSLDMGSTAALAAAISTLALAATVITTGMLADRLGRRKVLSVALLLTALGDILVLIAPDTGVFLLGRVLAGIGCGAIFGAAFAYVKHFATGKGGLPAALGIFTAIGGVGAVLLSFVGALLAGLDWRVAYVLIPIVCVVSLLLVAFVLPKDDKADRPTGSWDVLGQVLLGLGIVSLLYGIAHMSAGFGSPLTWGTMVAGVVLLVAFYFWERHSGEKAFFPIGLFKWPIFIAAVLIGLTYNLGYGASLLSFTNLFQYKLEFTNTRLALAQLPFLLVAIVAALVVGKIRGKGKITRRAAVLLGTIITGLGFASFAVAGLSNSDSYLMYLPGLLLAGAGCIIVAIPYGNMFLQSADPKHYGAVSSSRTTVGQFWYSLGLAGSTVLIDGLTRSEVQDKLGGSSSDELKEWAVSGGKVPAPAEVLDVAGNIYPGAFGIAMAVVGALCFGAGIAAYFIMRHNEKTHPDPLKEVPHA